MLAAAAARGGGPGAVAHAALELLYASGMRVSELLSVRRAALSRDAASLMIRGKGGKLRMVPLSAGARAAAAALVAQGAAGSEWLFPGRDPRRAMTRQGFALLLKQVALAARARSGAGLAACAAAFLCHPPAGARRRSAQPADPAGARGYRDDRDLHAYPARSVAAGAGGEAPAGSGTRAGAAGAVAVVSRRAPHGGPPGPPHARRGGSCGRWRARWRRSRGRSRARRP